MSSCPSQPTLLVFTRGAEQEARRRRLLPSRLATVELAVHQRCLDATLAAGRAAGCRVAISSPSPLARAVGVPRLAQTGRSFGERLRRALRRTLEESLGPVLIVGTDTPQLASRHLARAVELLEEDPRSVVVGPATDGGFYLLATRRPLDEVLAAVAWRQRSTVESLLAALAGAGVRVNLLEPLADLDRPQDLARWVSLDLGDWWWPLAERVRQALAALRRLTVPAVVGRPLRFALDLPGGRSPPTP